MRIELKNVAYNFRKSGSYRCYRATVLIDGEVAGVTSADGSGSINDYEPFELRTRLNEYAATLPRIVCDFEDQHRPGEKFSYAQCADGLIEALIEERLREWWAA